MAAHPLRKILSWQSILVAVVPFLVIMVLGFLWLYPLIIAESETRHRQLAGAIASQVESYLAGSLATVQGVAALLSDRQVSKDHSRLVLESLTGSTSNLSTIYIIRQDGKVLTTGLPRQQRENRPELEDIDLSRSPLFKEVVRRKHAVWSETFLSLVGGQLSVAVAVPTDGMVVIGEIELARLTAFLKRITVLHEQQNFVIDRRGQVIADQDGRYTAQQLNLSNIPLVKNGLNSNLPLTGRFDFSGSPMIGTISPVSYTDWRVLVTRPTGAVFRTVTIALRIAALGLLTALLTGIAIAVVLARRLSRRFEALAHNTRHLAMGEDLPDWPVGSIAEFEQLALDLHTMASAIQAREGALRDSEHNYRLLFDNMIVGFAHHEMIYDDAGRPVDYRYLKANPAFGRLTGLAPEAINGKTVREILPGIEDYWIETFGRVAQTGEPAAYQNYVKVLGRWYDTWIFSPRPDQFAVMFTDITERKRMEDELRESERRFSEMMSTTRLITLMLDPEGRVTFCNDALLHLTGWERDEVLGGNWFELFVPGRPGVREMFFEAIRTGFIPSHFENPILTRKGAECIVSWSNTILRDPGGTAVVGIASIGEDITERKEAEQALRESEERFHQLFAQSDDALLLLNRETLRVFDANPAAFDIFQVPSGEVSRIDTGIFIDEEGLRKLIDSTNLGDPTRVFTLDLATARRSDGSEITVSIRGKIIRLQDEDVVYCSFRNITERIRLEEQIRSTHAKLIQTNKMTSLGMLVSGVAHEINNPNHCIAMNVAVLSKAWEDAVLALEKSPESGILRLGGLPFTEIREVAPQLFSGITESSRKISTIVNDMREFVKPDKTGIHGCIDINRVVQGAASILWHHIHTFTSGFRMELPDGLPKVRGSSQQIEQVVVNLIMNALQSLPDKSRAVQVRTSCDRDAGIVSIRVVDEGKGMDREVLEHLMEPFFSTRIDEGGTGLGLYISASLVKEHGGNLSFESAPGGGTTATISLPLAEGAV